MCDTIDQNCQIPFIDTTEHLRIMILRRIDDISESDHFWNGEQSTPAKEMLRRPKNDILLLFKTLPPEQQELLCSKIFDSARDLFFKKKLLIPAVITELIHVHPIFKTQIASHIRKTLWQRIENQYASIQTEISFFLFLLGMDEDFDIIKDMQGWEFGKIIHLFAKFETLVRYIDDPAELSVELDLYLQFCEVINKLSAIYAVNLRDRGIMLKLTEIVDHHVQILIHDVLDKKEPKPEEYISELTNIRGRLKISYSHGRFIDATTKESILAQMAEVHARQMEGLYLCKSVDFWKNPIAKHVIPMAFQGNKISVSMIGIKRMVDLKIPIDQDLEALRMEGIIWLIGIYYGNSTTSNDTKTSQGVIEDFTKGALIWQQSRVQIETLHHIILFDNSLGVRVLMPLVLQLIHEENCSNFFYEEYRIKIIDVILERLLMGPDLDLVKKIDLIEKIAAYVQANKKLSTSVLSYSKIYLTIAVFLSQLCTNNRHLIESDTCVKNYNPVEKLHEYYLYFLNLKGKEPQEYNQQNITPLRSIGWLVWSEFGLIPKNATPTDSIFESTGRVRMEKYKTEFYTQALNDIGSTITATVNNSDLSARKIKGIAREFCALISEKIFGGICTLEIIEDCTECPNADLLSKDCKDCKNCNQKHWFGKEVIMFQKLWYRLEFTYPMSSEEIFMELFKFERHSVTKQASAILETYRRVIRERIALTKEKTANEKIRQLAYFDPTTGLPNKHSLMSDLDFAQENDTPQSVILLRVPDYDIVTQTGGGRELWEIRMKKIASILSNAEFEIGKVYRRDSFTFAIVSSISKELIQLFTENNWMGVFPSCPIRFDVGIAAEERHEVLRKADIALLKIKANGALEKGRAYFFKPWDENDAEKTGHYIKILDRALDVTDEEVRIIPYYQPICDYKGRIIKMEALARIEVDSISDNGTKEITLIAPNSFIPLAESRWDLSIITLLMLERITSDLKEYPSLNVSINFHKQDWNNEQIMMYLRNIRLQDGIHQTDRITLEILETVRLNHQEDKDKIKELKELGFTLAIDDYGTGESNDRRILDVQPDTIKIDRSIIECLKDETKHSETKAYIQKTVQLAHLYGRKVTAEYVESAELRNVLHDIGVDEFQGYFFWKPEPIGSILIK